MPNAKKDSSSAGVASEQEELVTVSFRVTKRQARALDLIASMSAKQRSEVIREILDEGIERRASPDAVEEMAKSHHDQLLKQAEGLRGLAS